MSRLGSEESAGGQWHSMAEKDWKLLWALALQAASRESRWSGTKSARRALASLMLVAMALLADGAADGEGEGEIAAQAGVAAEDERLRPPSWASRQSPWRSMGMSARESALMSAPPRVPSTRTVPVSPGAVSVRRGWASSRRCHWWGSGSQRAKSASVREKGVFSCAELEVEAGAGGFDVGEAAGGAGEGLGSGCSLDARGLEEQALDVPVAVGGADEVDAGWAR